MKITHTQLPTNGLPADLQKGVSAAYAALLDDKLIVAGGCNFPYKPPYEGGEKIFYDEILMMNIRNPDQWEIVGNLPERAAYGASVQLKNSALWIAGNNSTNTFNHAYRVRLENDSIRLENFPALPATFDNFAGCSLNEKVFVGGGNENGKPSNSIYMIHAAHDNEWTKLPDYPGTAHVQPVMAALEIDNKEYLYLMGGFFGGDAGHQPEIAVSVLRYSINDKKWDEVGEQIDPETQIPFSLGGATAMPLNNRYILALGGVNYDVFLDALTAIHSNRFDNSITDEERANRAKEFSLNYMTQPVAYYNFNKEYRLYDTHTHQWTVIERSKNGARAGATLVADDKTFYVVQGELKPGVRTPETWKGNMEITTK